MDVRMFLITTFCLIGIGGGSLTAKQESDKSEITDSPDINRYMPSSSAERGKVFCSAFNQKIAASGRMNTHELDRPCPEKYSQLFGNYQFGTRDTVEDIENFIYTVCGSNIGSCLRVASEYIIELGFGFKSATIFDTFYRTTLNDTTLSTYYLDSKQLDQLTELTTFFDWSKSPEANSMSDPIYTCMVNIYDCLADSRYNVREIKNGLEGINELLSLNTITREDLYDECTAVWMYGVYLREKRKPDEPPRNVDPDRSTKLQKIFSTLMVKPKRPSNDEGEEEEESEEYLQRQTCTKEDYNPLIKQLLTKNYDEETIRFLTQERFLGPICSAGMLRRECAFKIELIKEFVDMYGLEKGMKLLTQAANYKLSSRIVERLHYRIKDLESIHTYETLMNFMPFINEITSMNTNGK